jgi:glutathione peroxidase
VTGVYDFSADNLSGAAVDFQLYRGKVLLIVNTASYCGKTPQYKGLEALHRQFHDQGLEVLGFPCNQFGKQEPGDAGQISAFCVDNYKVTFPLFAKIDVNGASAHPLFNYLKEQARGIFGSRSIKWNFTKFLVRKDGTVFRRYAPGTTPEQLTADVKTLLAEGEGNPSGDVVAGSCGFCGAAPAARPLKTFSLCRC